MIWKNFFALFVEILMRKSRWGLLFSSTSNDVDFDVDNRVENERSMEKERKTKVEDGERERDFN